MVRAAARDGLWVQQRDGTMFTIHEELITALLELCLRWGLQRACVARVYARNSDG